MSSTAGLIGVDGHRKYSFCEVTVIVLTKFKKWLPNSAQKTEGDDCTLHGTAQEGPLHFNHNAIFVNLRLMPS